MKKMLCVLCTAIPNHALRQRRVGHARSTVSNSAEGIDHGEGLVGVVSEGAMKVGRGVGRKGGWRQARTS
jgi:hypothetical protein